MAEFQGLGRASQPLTTESLRQPFSRTCCSLCQPPLEPQLQLSPSCSPHKSTSTLSVCLPGLFCFRKSGGGRKVRKTALVFEFLIAVHKLLGGQNGHHSTNLLEARTVLGWVRHRRGRKGSPSRLGDRSLP